MSNLEKAFKREVERFIQDELEYDSVKSNKNGIKDYLESLTDEDKAIIVDKLINDDYLWNEINSSISYEVYHYKNWYKEEEK